MSEEKPRSGEKTYAVVFYLDGPLAPLVNALRAELNPQNAGKAAHVTVLPPRPLVISEEAAIEEARNQLTEWEPFEIEVNGIGTFFPVNGVVYLELQRGAEEIKRLHVVLNRGFLQREEPYEFIPHVTISQDMDERCTQEVMARVTEAWTTYKGPRVLSVETLMFVRLSPAGDWEDLAALQLGRTPVPAQ